MLSDNHWIVPTIAGEYRVNKPPTMGWFIAASMMVFQSKAEWVARLPAMLAGVGTCLLLASMTTRHLGRRVGLLTGLLTATSLFVLTQARLSEADMPLVMFVVLAFWVISRFIHQAEVGKTELAAAAPVVGWSVMFFFAVGMSFLLKGVGPIFVLPAAVVYAGLA
ncbi:MAG TPA: glycosyltransferase family 39 protein, partial [Tepidisphaeraceae bacterium]|nr:glycosyltransferase family 39 protein [Tepidisphaeraceae bacterium]